MGYVSRWRTIDGKAVREFVLEHEVNVSLVGLGARNMRGEISTVVAPSPNPAASIQTPPGSPPHRSS
jgi:hypothetical protein